MSAFTTRWSWRFLRRNASLEEVIDRLNDRMRMLEDILNRWADDLESGPIPGAYVMVTFSYTEAGGLTTGIKENVPISFDAVVRAVYAYANPVTDTLTIDINNGSTSILTTPLSLTDSATLNASSDFANNGVISPPGLNLEIDSIDSGTPVHVRVVVMLQNVTRVEDQ